jgi:hypothetical protein
MFKWNGSEITDFIKDEETLIEEAKYNQKTYWIIKHGENEEICMKKNTKSSIPCLVDELKPVFGLEKIGTHWFRFKSKIMIIFKVNIENGVILEDLPLNEIEYKRELETEIRRIFLFREFLGTTSNFERNIILRHKNYFVKPLSFYETSMVPSHSGKVIPDTILDKWFKDTSLEQAIKTFFGVTKFEDINRILLDLKDNMSKIFLRVNPDAITNLDEIISRIRTRLQFVLDN